MLHWCTARARLSACQRGLTSQFLHLSHSGSPIVVPRLENEEWDGREHRDTSSSYVRLPFLSSHLPPCLSGDRYATAGRAMEVWINLTTAGSNCGGTGGGGAWRLRAWKEKRAGKKKRLNPKTRRTEFLDMKERNRQMKAWGLGLKWFRTMDDNTPNRNAK